MNKLGIVFSGGGGKGPFQLGAWRYLRESGLDKYVGCVSGTSIGALNSALFISAELEYVEQIWRNIRQTDITMPTNLTASNILSGLKSSLGFLAIPLLLDPLAILGTAAVATLAQSATMLFSDKGAVFTQDGIKEKIKAGVNFNAIRASSIPCYVTCLNLNLLKGKPFAERFDLRKYSDDEITSIIMASCAIPGVYKPVQFRKNTYWDGGFTPFGDNVPVKPVYDEGMSVIIVLHLSPDAPTNPSLYPGAKIIDIYSSVDLGGMLEGTMDFTSKGAIWRMEQGYKDTRAQLEPIKNDIIRAMGGYYLT